MILIGRILSPHGVKGYVKVKPFTDFLERFKAGYLIKIKSSNSIFEFLIEDSFFHKEFVCLKLENIKSYEEALNLKGKEIVIYENELKELDKDSYYIHDLIGLSVVDQFDNVLGTIKDVYQFISNDAYEIELSNGKKILYPALKEFIDFIDLEKKIMRIKNFEGIFD